MSPHIVDMAVGFNLKGGPQNAVLVTNCLEIHGTKKQKNYGGIYFCAVLSTNILKIQRPEGRRV
jgi:hypothetical protein